MAKFFYVPFASHGDVQTTPDDDQPSGAVSYYRGYGADYQLPLAGGGAAIPINRAQFNSLMNDITGAMQIVQEQGVFTWIGPVADSPLLGANFPYPINALVYYNGLVYQSLIANNQDTPGATANWALLSALGTLPPGAFMDFGGTAAPAGYLVRNGASYLRADYPALFAAIGTTWGSVDGTHFNVPNSQRSVSVGSGGSGTAELGNSVGSVGGEETHLMTVNELVGHTHNVIGGNNAGNFNATPRVSASATDLGNATSSTGNSAPFNVIQPSIIMLPCIKY